METVTLYIQFSAVGLLLICGGMLGVSVRKMNVQIVKMETVTIFGKKWKECDVLCVACMKLTVKYFFI